MNKSLCFFEKIKSIINDIKNEHLGAFAAQSSFFFIMSFFPLTFLVFSILKISKYGLESFSELIYSVLPYSGHDAVKSIFENFVYKSSSILSLTTLLAAWSAGKGFYALTEGFHSVLFIHEKRNYVYLRIRSLLYSIGFSFIIAILFILGVFGKTIQTMLLQNYPKYFDYTYLITVIRVLFIVFTLFILIFLLFSFLPDWKSYIDTGGERIRIKIRSFCSLVSAFVIYIYTIIFSLGTKFFLSVSNIYGGISAFISIMLWVYGTMYIIMLGLKLSVFLNKSR